MAFSEEGKLPLSPEQGFLSQPLLDFLHSSFAYFPALTSFPGMGSYHFPESQQEAQDSKSKPLEVILSPWVILELCQVHVFLESDQRFLRVCK